jgi:hypothetical protein
MNKYLYLVLMTCFQGLRGLLGALLYRYGFELESSRIAKLTDKLMTSYTILARDIENFCQFLQALE